MFIAATRAEGTVDEDLTNLPQAPDQAVAGGFSKQDRFAFRQPSAIGDRPACETSGCETIVQLDLLLQCAART